MPRLNTVLELHIEVNQGLQKVDAYRQNMFGPEEIDLHLTKQQERFLDELFSNEFQDVQLRLDYIRSLIVKNKRIVTLQPDITDPLYEPNMVYAVLPADYKYLVSDRSKVITSIAKCADLSTLLSTGVVTEYVATVDFPIPEITVPPYYTDFEIKKTEASIETEIYLIPDAYQNYLNEKDAKFMLINDILEKMNRVYNPLTRIYWENYRNIFYPGKFIFVRGDAAWTSITMNTYNNDSTPLIDVSTTGTFTSSEYEKAILTSEIADQESELIGNKLVEGDELHEQNKNEFFKTSKQEPTSSIAGDFLYLYTDKSFIINEAVIDYVRKPRQISLSLDQTCELGSSAARAEIVDRTVEYLKLLIENPAYKDFKQDNLIRNQNSLTNG